MSRPFIQADSLASKIKHSLITNLGVTIEEASAAELYHALSRAIREEVMINWTATQHTYIKHRPRTVYYLCMEYMPGRLLENNLQNIHASELIHAVMEKLGRNFDEIAGVEQDPALGNGGLGRLASCLLDSLATQQYPAFGYGLRYQYGIFEQEIWDGGQVERPETWLLHENPWESRQEKNAINVFYGGEAVNAQNEVGEEVYDLQGHEEVRALSYDLPIVGYRESADFTVNSLRLWTTKESPRNFELQRYNAGLLDEAAENTHLTDVLYPNDFHEMGKRVRLKQEFLLVSASIQDLVYHYPHENGRLGDFADKVRIHINDTHPALAIAELMHILLKNYQYKWAEAFEVVRTCCNYTNHTVLKEALEEWNEERVFQLLPRQYRIIQRLNEDFCKSIRKTFPGDEEKLRRMSIIEGGQIRMANLAIYGSHKVNGVAALHTEILKKDIFKDFHEMYPDKLVNVTNGVTQRRWLHHCNPALADFITERIGNLWITDLSELKKLALFAADPSSREAFLRIKRENKEAFVQYLEKENPTRGPKGEEVAPCLPLDASALFDVQIKRFHEYKRQLLCVFHTLVVYNQLKQNPEARSIARMVIIGGKAAPGYGLMKDVIRFIFCLKRKINTDSDTSSKLRLVFLENYNASRAEKIIPAADLSEQISCAGMEASGTGNMKLSLNGALTIGTEDGANIEMHADITDEWWPFGFGATAEENRHRSHPQDHSPEVLAALEMLKDGSLASPNSKDGEALLRLHHYLTENDRFFVLGDFPSYFEAQHKVEALYQDPHKWAETALQNMAHMYRFSTDESIKNYAELIWGLKKCGVDQEELERVQKQFNEYDKFRLID